MCQIWYQQKKTIFILTVVMKQKKRIEAKRANTTSLSLRICLANSQVLSHKFTHFTKLAQLVFYFFNVPMAKIPSYPLICIPHNLLPVTKSIGFAIKYFLSNIWNFKDLIYRYRIERHIIMCKFYERFHRRYCCGC